MKVCYAAIAVFADGAEVEIETACRIACDAKKSKLNKLKVTLANRMGMDRDFFFRHFDTLRVPNPYLVPRHLRSQAGRNDQERQSDLEDRLQQAIPPAISPKPAEPAADPETQRSMIAEARLAVQRSAVQREGERP